MPDQPLTPEEIAENLAMLTHVKSWLRYRDRNQRELADALGMSEPAISKWLRGTQRMTIAQFPQIANYLEAKPEELLGAPPAAALAARYRQIAEVAQNIPDDALAEWLALGQRLSGTRKPST